MKGKVECMRCHALMESGFVVDGRDSGFAQQTWSPGEPQPSFWTGVKLETTSLIPVTTLRCPKCGYLESYALGKDRL